MVFRISAVLVALAMAASAAADSMITVCHITSDANPKTFETVKVSAAEFPSYESAGDLEGPCEDWLGQLCSDDIKCTADYDYETAKCLPLPRAMMEECTEES